ncbi:hypothetical protein Enr10x_37480 [Gimesia panareensis]|uniref:Trypsin n=1 Tax=Gimesia panareensis TaxID=2527978 RepID=A0A517Q9V2_9PLAN|nr:hypothetical protein [Gimesia panareensis]QDT28406.1 hypothetical protein Enr10x_37480 [Gimesia panareensis]
MHYSLREIAFSIEKELRDFLARVSEHIRGVQLYFDEYWLEAYILEIARHSPWKYMQPPGFGVGMLSYAAKYLGWKPDLDYLPPRWNDHCRARGFSENSHPVIIRLILRDPNMNFKQLDLGNQFQNFPLVYQYRPRCDAYASQLLRSGECIGQENPDTAGTLGGFLEDSSGKQFLISCAHVVQGDETRVYRPGPADSSLGEQVAIVRYSRHPEPTPQDKNCNSRSMSSGSNVDLACAEIDDGYVSAVHPRTGPITDINDIADIIQGMPVSFIGKTTGYQDAQVGAVCIWYEIEFNNVPHCFSDIFEITHPKPYYLNTNLARPGDSGAWVVSNENLCTSWNGVLIGGDGAQAYACYAENVMHELKEYSSDLSLGSRQGVTSST